MKTPSTDMHLTKTERFLRTITGKSVDHPPVWLMRQAGRYMPEYQAVRKNYDFLTMCRTPQAAAKVSLQPLEILDVDAVIVFNDIVIPMDKMGIPVTFTNKGPALKEPVRNSRIAEHFQIADFDHDEPVFNTLSLLRESIGPDVPLLGFAGAPFTMACYAIEGNLTKNLDIIKEMRYLDPGLLHSILDKIAHTVVNYLRIQIEAGVNLVQIFDTWAASLSLPDYKEFAFRYQKQIIDAIKPLGVPVTLYVNGSTPLLEMMVESGADVISVDWRLPLSEVRKRIGADITIQGNLDPTALYNTPEGVAEMTREMLGEMSGDPRYIANLGHGILPKTSVESVRAFINTVKGEAL